MSLFAVLPTISKEVDELLVKYKPKLRQLLFNHNLQTLEEAEIYLNPSYETGLHDPFLLHDMDKGVERILTAIKNNERTVIYSDYDCDGIPGAVVLHDFFKAVGYENFNNHIPHRHYDGFGLSEKGVRSLKEKENPALIITIDCGTTDSEATNVARELSIDVIITDHHEPKAELPKAVAVINPKIGSTYPFTGLCGAGVIFKLVQALLLRGNFELKEGREKWWLDMVGIATIADMVPLTGENRALAHFGLKVLRKSPRPGLQQLLLKQKASQQHLTEDDIGFTIGPRINAASRMDTPEDAFMLLATTDVEEAGDRVAHLEKLNQDRKTAVALMTKEIHKRLKSEETKPEILVLGNPDWRPSLVGLSATKLSEEYGCPVFLWGRDGNEAYKGSCRSVGAVSVVKVMESATHLFTEFGGHHQSGGFAIVPESIHTFSEELVKAYKKLGNEAIISELYQVDMELTLDEFNHDLLEAQRLCAPFGLGNHKPLYLLKDITPIEVQVFGKTKEHTKLVFDTKGLAKEAIAFFKTPAQFSKLPTTDSPISLLVHLEESFFMGRLQTRLRIVEIL